MGEFILEVDVVLEDTFS